MTLRGKHTTHFLAGVLAGGLLTLLLIWGIHLQTTSTGTSLLKQGALLSPETTPSSLFKPIPGLLIQNTSNRQSE